MVPAQHPHLPEPGTEETRGPFSVDSHRTEVSPPKASPQEDSFPCSVTCFISRDQQGSWLQALHKYLLLKE